MIEKYRDIEAVLRNILRQTDCHVVDHHIREALDWLEKAHDGPIYWLEPVPHDQ